MARSLGAKGIVIGALDEKGKIDLAGTRELVRAANGLPVTFHRAFDHVANPGEALEQLIDVGVARILTSGGANTALEGAPRIAALVSQAGERLRIIAGGRVRENNVREIIALTGVTEVHARIASLVCAGGSARTSLKLRKRLPDNEGAWEELDESRMRDLVNEAG
jgi:copper homeostasis protein